MTGVIVALAIEPALDTLARDSYPNRPMSSTPSTLFILAARSLRFSGLLVVLVLFAIPLARGSGVL